MNPRARKLLAATGALLLSIAALWLVRAPAAYYLSAKGRSAIKEWRIASAVNYFDWAYYLSGEAAARFQKGICLQLLGKFRASQNEFDAILAAPNHETPALYNAVGINRYSFAESHAAADAHTKALELAKASGDRRSEAEALIGLSRVFYHSQGKFAEAISYLETAGSIARDIGDEGVEAAALRNTGTVYWWFKGELDRPLNEYYFPALELYRRQGDKRGEATMLTLIALVYNSKGDVYRFMQYQRDSIALQESIGDEGGLSDSYISMGQMYDGIGNYRKAGEFYRKGLEITEQNGYRLAQIDLRSLMAQVHIRLGEYDEAIEKYDPLGARNDPDSLDFNIMGVANSYKLKDENSRALSLYQRALNAHRRSAATDVRYETVLLFRIADCYTSLGDLTRGEESLDEAETIFNSIDTHSSGEMEPALIRAAIAKGKGDPRSALDHLGDALETERRIFAEASTSFLIPPDRRDYDRLFSLLIELAGSGDKDISARTAELAFYFHENARYRSLRNFFIRLKEKRPRTAGNNDTETDLAAEIKALSAKLAQNKNDDSQRERLRKAYSAYEDAVLRSQLDSSQSNAIKTASPASLKEVRDKLSPDTVFLEFIFARDTSAVLAVGKERLDLIPMPETPNALAAKVKLLRSLLFEDGRGDEWVPVAQSLRAALIEPVERTGVLRGVSRIGIVPRGFLYDLPFDALAGPGNGRIRFLVEDYILFQTPSVTFNTHKDNIERIDVPAQSALVLGRNEFPRTGQPSLEFAAGEAEAVGQILAGRVLLNSDATETAFKQSAPGSAYLHLSTHAIAETDMPLLSRVLLSPSDTDDGDLTVREIFELGLNARLVTLSACETGRSFSASGNPAADEDRLGLIEAFLHAGSESVLASTFPVSDFATRHFMASFYTHLRSHDRGESLALTQRSMINDLGQDGFSHPKYWSPFVLNGVSR